MSFNVIAETSKRLDYSKIHRKIYSDTLNFDLIPMPGLGLNGGDAIGISIPLGNANAKTWDQLRPVLKTLKFRFGMDVYDLFGGQKLGIFNIDSFKENLMKK